jgi:alanine-glyoxylate transaminase/serine-glyoxylate transaminase/serine-pyruvate transaminase
MQNYEAKKASYFATPSPQLIHALHTSLTQILSRPLSERFAAQRAASQRVKKAVADLGLKQLASNPAEQANGMTAIYLPENVKAPELLPNLLKKGIIFAGGLHKEIAAKYIRFGHMGVSVVSICRVHSFVLRLTEASRLTLSAMILTVQSKFWNQAYPMRAIKRHKRKAF